jgi:hypothetical protein
MAGAEGEIRDKTASPCKLFEQKLRSDLVDSIGTPVDGFWPTGYCRLHSTGSDDFGSKPVRGIQLTTNRLRLVPERRDPIDWTQVERIPSETGSIRLDPDGWINTAPPGRQDPVE